MRIKKLIIRGFGPYADMVELDFENSLMGKNMFVITGNTGAGKTTIFDAINFALYGEASGSDRDGKSLRSDFASPETPTEVELWFTLREQEYYVKRNPAYRRPKTRGEGFTDCAANAELRDPKGKVITGAGNVVREVEAVLGINAKQFKQLVMIPQGEFKQLLGASSDEKEDIFRKIFSTEIFERIERNIAEQANLLEKGVRKIREERAAKIRSFDCKDRDETLFGKINSENLDIDGILASFSAFIEEDAKDQERLGMERTQLEERIAGISKDLLLADENNQKLERLMQSETELAGLNKQQENQELQKKSLEKARKAIGIKPYEDKYNERHIAREQLGHRLKDIEGRVKSYSEQNERAEKALFAEQARESEKNGLLQQVNENEKLKPLAQEYEETLLSQSELGNQVRNRKESLKTIAAALAKNDARLGELNLELENIDKSKDEKASAELLRSECGNKGVKLDNLGAALKQLRQDQSKHLRQTSLYEARELVFKQTREAYEKLEEAYRRSQAGILASGLTQGSPCPVCGSTQHPNPAALSRSYVTEDEVKKGAEQLEKARKERDELLNELTKLHTAINAILDQVVGPLAAELLGFAEDGGTTQQLEARLAEAVTENKGHLELLTSKIAKLDKLSGRQPICLKEREELSEQNRQLRMELQRTNEQLAEAEGKLGAVMNTAERIRKEFGGEIKSAKELSELGKSFERQLVTMKKAYEDAENEFNRSKTLLNQEQGLLRAAQQQLAELEQEYQAALDQFKQKSNETGFEGYKDYKASLMTQQEMQAIENGISEYERKRSGAQSLFEARRKEAEGVSRIDVAPMQEELKNIELQRMELLNRDRSLYARISSNTQILASCRQSGSLIEKEEERYGVLGSLAKIINGNNARNISFERYVLAEYFEDIIKAANLRFMKMTAGRFELLRKQEIGDKRKGQGLDMEVFDNYTGKARDVKTLSGGESFKASLSLALGLADIVQENAGGIQLDTMFIDEGFGTLDPESLDNAVECLMQLQNDGRLVGLISHVPELRERIPTRLVVTAANNGSSASFRN